MSGRSGERDALVSAIGRPLDISMLGADGSN
jgi:hypothetical protein